MSPWWVSIFFAPIGVLWIWLELDRMRRRRTLRRRRLYLLFPGERERSGFPYSDDGVPRR